MMRIKRLELEKLYQLFLLSINNPLNHYDIDYFGINIDSSGEYKFKIYYSEKASPLQKDNLYCYLQSNEMIRYREAVLDSTNVNRYRNDFGLKNRNNENITNLFSFIERNSRLNDETLQLAKKLSTMKTTDFVGYDYSSLYFVGAEERDGLITKAKFHYFCKFCNNPDDLENSNNQYMDCYFLEFLQHIGIPQYNSVIETTRIILTQAKAHLWMIGLDLGEKANKYKIYLKFPEDVLLYHTEMICASLSTELGQVVEWYLNNREFDFSGVALCVDDHNQFSVNLYF